MPEGVPGSGRRRVHRGRGAVLGGVGALVTNKVISERLQLTYKGL